MLAQLHTKCIFHYFFVSFISYRQTDLSLKNNFQKMIVLQIFSSNLSVTVVRSSNSTTMAIVKSCLHNFIQSAYFMTFFVYSISYRPTDQKNFPKMSVFEKISLNLSQQRPLISNYDYYDYCKIVMPQLHTKCIFHHFFLSRNRQGFWPLSGM